MRIRKTIVLSLILLISMLFNMVQTTAKSRELSSEQERIADKVAETVADNWENYGVLPSVAVAQTFVESSLGVNQVRPNNLWGIRPGGNYSAYASLEDGIYAYLNVLNNGLYDKALHKKDYKVQLLEILQGGYYGEDDGGTIEEYYQDCVDSIRDYHFDRYDKRLFRCMKRKAENRRKRKWEKTYTLVYDSSVPSHAVMVDTSVIKQGAVLIWKDDEMQGIYDVIGGSKGLKIRTSNPYMDGMKVKIEVHEEAKG